MAIIEVKQSSLTVPIQVGDLTEKKIGIITKQLNTTKFINLVRVPVGLIYFAKENNESILVNSDRISYNNNGNTFDKQGVDTAFKKLFDTLLLDEDVRVILDIQGASITKDSHQESLKIFNEKYNNLLKDHQNIYGVGYRFLFNGENENGEIKIEPLVRDKRYYFYQYIINYDKINIYDSISHLNEKIHNFESIFECFKNSLTSN